METRVDLDVHGIPGKQLEHGAVTTLGVLDGVVGLNHGIHHVAVVHVQASPQLVVVSLAYRDREQGKLKMINFKAPI